MHTLVSETVKLKKPPAVYNLSLAGQIIKGEQMADLEIMEDWEIELEEDLWIEMYERGIVEMTDANKAKYKDLKEREIR